jgi:uncharacterized SAM-binding protein YcdF (DUF218 family)
MIRRTGRFFARLVLLFAALIVLMGVLPVGPWLHHALVEADAPRRADAIVVLGGGIVDDDLLGASTTSRLVHGLRLQHRGYAPIVILTGGNPIDPRTPESVVMRKVAEEVGARPDILVIETVADRTSTQGEAVARIARARGVRRILLVTSPEHSFRAARVFRKTGLDVISTPVIGRETPRPALMFHPMKVVNRLAALVPWMYEGGALAMYWWRGQL